ncbi:porin family protein [Thalassotalea sp. M1531]|uniref:Porin family protein n=1 Tax=Thalassotalea algicola TaxID=2716224 RepID=A0A7Y0LAC4_9GAMM|nr:outer membrane beta-barrel protein [Thalassotalea algicola]NMP30001.1 porin family protein [Thalassotalea algicola]
MFKKSAIALLTLSLSLSASANWQVGGGYMNLSDDSDDLDVSLNGVYGSIAYNYKMENEKFSIVPEFRLGTGVSEDTVDGYYYDVDIELERFIALSARAQYQMNDNFYMYALPSYANAKLKASIGSTSESDDDWEFGYGVGAGFNFRENGILNFSYEQYDDADLFTASLSIQF